MPPRSCPPPGGLQLQGRPSGRLANAGQPSPLSMASWRQHRCQSSGRVGATGVGAQFCPIIGAGNKARVHLEARARTKRTRGVFPRDAQEGVCGRTTLRASRMPRSFWRRPLWTTTRTGSILRWAILRPASLSASWMVGINGGRIHSEKSAESGIKNRGPDHNRGKWHPKDAILQINRICKRTHPP